MFLTLKLGPTPDDDEAFEASHTQSLALFLLTADEAPSPVAQGRDIKVGGMHVDISLTIQRSLLSDHSVYYLSAGHDHFMWLGRFSTLTKEAALPIVSYLYRCM